MIEAGAYVSFDTFDSWPAVAQDVWLEERERIDRLRIALLARTIADEMRGGELAEDMVWETLDEKAQAGILEKRTAIQRHQDEMLRRMNVG